MNKKQLEAKLNVSHTTIYKWIKRFDSYFSDAARSGRREYSQEDLDILATIASLSIEGLNYDAIEKRLDSGERVAFEETTLGVDSRMIPAVAVEQMLDATEIRIELEQVRAERDKLYSMLEEIKADFSKEREKNEALLREMGQIQERAARAEAQVEMLKEILGSRNNA